MRRIEQALRKWALEPDGPPILTRTSRLLPVRLRNGDPAMLKQAIDAEEMRGNLVMAWWDGDGAAPVLAQDGDLLLMERASSGAGLTTLVDAGRDEEATRIACAVIRRLHRRRGGTPPATPSLGDWFAPLLGAETEAGALGAAAQAARELLAEERAQILLHGDVHHANILDFGGEWLSIDPKGVRGDRTFDYVNLLRNPDLGAATADGLLAPRAEAICKEAGVEPRRLLKWLLSFSGLSALWTRAEGGDPEWDFAMMRLAAETLRSNG